jgi:hypothetical protein
MIFIKKSVIISFICFICGLFFLFKQLQKINLVNP